MINEEDISVLLDLIVEKYAEPRRKTVKLKPPDPMEMEVEEEVLISHDEIILKTENFESKAPNTKVRLPAMILGVLIGIFLLVKTPQLIAGIIGTTILVFGYYCPLIFRRRITETREIDEIVRVKIPEKRIRKVSVGAKDYPLKSVEVKTVVKRNNDDYLETNKTITLQVPPQFAPLTEEITIPNPEKVRAIGRIELKFKAIPLGTGTVIIGEDDFQKIHSVNLPVFSDAAKIKGVILELDQLAEEMPAVLGGDRETIPIKVESGYRDGAVCRGEEIQIHDHFVKLAKHFNQLNRKHLSIQCIPPHDPIISIINPRSSTSEPFDSHDKDLSFLGHWVGDNELHDTIEHALAFIEKWRHLSMLLAGVRFVSLQRGVSPIILEYGVVSHYTSFNFYCPICHEEQINDLLSRDYKVASERNTPPIYFSPNSRCSYNYERKIWKCCVCESETSQPIPIHKLLDEVFYPTYDRLMEENKLARFDLDNKTRDDELEFKSRLDREAEDLVRNHRQVIDETSTKMEFLQAEIEGYVHAIGKLEELARKVKTEHLSILGEFHEQGRRIQSEAASQTQSLIQFLNESLRQRIAMYSAQVTELSVAKRREDFIRDAIQVDILRQTYRVADATEESAKHLEKIEGYTGRTADATEKSAKHLEKIEGYTGRTADATEKSAGHLEKIEGYTGRTADATEKSIKQLTGIKGEIEHGNAISAALAKKSGADINDYAWWRVGKNVKKGTATISSALRGESSTERQKRIRRAVR